MIDRKQVKVLAPYVLRAAQSEQARAQASRAVSALGGAFERISEHGVRSAGDKRVQQELADALGALRRVASAMQEPPPKRRRGRVLLLLAGAGAAAFALRKAKDGQLAGLLSARSGQGSADG